MPTESHEFYKAFGARVATARKARRITQAKLASVLGLSRTSVTNIEKGRQQVQVHTLARLADILSVHVSELLPSKQLLETRTVTDNLRSYAPETREWATRIISIYEGADNNGIDAYLSSKESKGTTPERERNRRSGTGRGDRKLRGG